jgi:hypothetical protein
MYHGEPVNWGRITALRLVDWFTCALFFAALFYVVRRFPFERKNWVSEFIVIWERDTQGRMRIALDFYQI